ncbi:MAG: DAK2 domain-containing protein [Metamycoplasmataceae bacterium]
MKQINLKTLKEVLLSASNNLVNNVNRINALNIFPVPDGDTGSNMSSTLRKPIESIEFKEYNSISLFMKELSKEMLLSARGNSGVILSQIFKGFYEGWKNVEVITSKNFLEGFKKAKELAYSSVLKPIEGTILTVIRETYEGLEKIKITDNIEITEIFKIAMELSRKSCDNTPNLLPVLKEADVVDSGGEGLFIIFEGIYNSLINNPVKINDKFIEQEAFISDSEIYDGEFGYCTETIIKLENAEKFNKDSVANKLSKIGNSLVIVNDVEILKVHIHTLKPGEILNFLQKYGEFIKIKSENMTIQASETKNKINSESSKKQTKKKTGIVSCNSGSGIIETMKQYECDFIVDGGQSNNPSLQDFLDGINQTNSDNIIILPNNKNIILVAQQAAKMVKDKNVVVIPTKSQIEGLTAIINFSGELNFEDNVNEIKTSLKDLLIGEITKSIKDTKIDNISIKKNSYIQIQNNKIIGCKSDLLKAAKSLIKNMLKQKKDPEIIIVYYGDDTTRMDAEELEKFVEENYDVEIEIHAGYQPIYNFLISIE